MRGSRERAQRNLYVLNLPLDATTGHFEALFAQYGSVEHAVILATLDHLARRRGFILMADPAQARAAISSLNGHVWHHYRIEVSFAIVQRSGTPFSQDAAVDSSRQERPLQPTPAETFSQPLQHAQADDNPPCPDQKVHRGLPGQISDDATLLISGLDTTVITSPAMVRALTEPFGHIVELQSPAHRHETRVNSQAIAVYCCPSSAALARLALNGLVIGRSRVQASLRRSAMSKISNTYDTETGDTSASIVCPPHQSDELGAAVASSQTRGASSLCTLPAQTVAAADPGNLAQGHELLAHDQYGGAGYIAHSDPWYHISLSSEVTNKHVLEDPSPKQRVSSTARSAACSIDLGDEF